MSTRKRAPVITQPTLPSGMHPLVWGKWPSADARLSIDGHSGVWAYAGYEECGRDMRFVWVVPYALRGDQRTTRYVAPVEWVRVEDEAQP